MEQSIPQVIGWNPEWWGPKNKPENLLFVKTLSEVVHGGEIVLDVGCGDYKTHSRLIGVDAYNPAAEVKAYMWDLPFEDDSIDGIVSLHSMEHISKYKVPDTLLEFQRVLKPGARFLILVPNLIWVLQRFIDNPNLNWEMDMIFGSQDGEGQFHKTGFTPEIIKQYWTIIPDCEIEALYDVHAYKQQNHGIITRKKERNGSTGS